MRARFRINSMHRMQLVENNHWYYNIEGKFGFRMTGLKDPV